MTLQTIASILGRRSIPLVIVSAIINHVQKVRMRKFELQMGMKLQRYEAILSTRNFN